MAADIEHGIEIVRDDKDHTVRIWFGDLELKARCMTSSKARWVFNRLKKYITEHKPVPEELLRKYGFE